MIQPNRLSVPGEAAARARVEVVFAAVDGLSPQLLAQAVIGRTDPDERDRLLDVLEEAVTRSGREELLDAARGPVNRVLQAKVADSILGAAYGAMVASSGPVDDRVAVFQAIDDAVCVAVAEDLLELDDARVLSDPGRAFLGLPPVGDGAEPARAPGRERHMERHIERRGWEPTDADWTDAQPSPADRSALLPGVRGLWQLMLGAIAVIGIPAAVALGASSDQLWLGILAAVAIGVVCWTLAMFRRAT